MCNIHIIYTNEQISKSLRMFNLSIEDTIYMIDEQIVVFRKNRTMYNLIYTHKKKKKKNKQDPIIVFLFLLCETLL